MKNKIVVIFALVILILIIGTIIVVNNLHNKNIYMNESTPKKENYKLGTIKNPIIDSNLTREDALRPNPNFNLSKEVFERQALIPIIYIYIYISFDGKYHQGQIVMDKDLEKDVVDFFNFLQEQNFSINKI